MKVKANGKFNLTLFVTGMRGRMHVLDSVMHSVDIGDELTVEESDRVSVVMRGADVDERSNTAYRAAEAVREKYGLALHAEIVKHIPIGGGMGGSSADAAGVLACAERMLGVDLTALASEIGSDVPFMMRGGCARVRGIGDVLEPLPAVGFSALTIDCGRVDTAACYRAFDESGGPTGGSSDDAAADISAGRMPSVHFNALFSSASALQPRISDCMNIARSAGLTAHMTGSGGCMFITDAPDGSEKLFENAGFRCFRVRSANAGVEIS